MPAPVLLVLSEPTAPYLALLEGLPEETTIVVGDRMEAFVGHAGQTDVIFCGLGQGRLLAEMLPLAPRAQWVHSFSAGLDQILFPALIESPVVLTNSRGVFRRSLAEFVLAAALYFAKGFRRMVHSQEAGLWDPFDVEELAGRVMGIVGYGEIGRASAALAAAFGMKVVALRRRVELSSGDAMLEAVLPAERRLELMARSDYVVVSAPLTPATLGLVGEAELRAMKPIGVLINVGRGPVVDEAALIRALEQRRIRGAALDVFDREPLPDGHPFYRLDNVLLSAHCADHTVDWREAAMRLFVENFRRYCSGEPLLNVVDKAAGY